jgi:hypothetical protein
MAILQHSPRYHAPHPNDVGRRVHDLVHGYRPYHGGGPPFSAPHLRALLEILETEGHDVVELREELAQLLRALMRARHGATKFDSRR